MKTKKKTFLSNNKKLHTTFYVILGIAFILRLILADSSNGFETDLGCFSFWANRAYQVGFTEFYSPDVFTDYPPGYIYILYIIGAIFNALKIEAFSGPGLILLKMPSLLTDLFAGILIYVAANKYINKNTGLLFSALYLFNPAVLINSVVWGQVDSILAFLVILLCFLLMEGKIVPSAFVFAAGLLFKPQMLIFAPLLLYGIYEHEIIGFRNWKKFFTDLSGGLAALAFLVLGALPFGLSKVIAQYTDTLGSYPYVSVNAYNFWAMFGLNWKSQEGTFLGITYAMYGKIALVALTLISAVIFEVLRRKKSEVRYILAGAFIITTTFMFSVRMHERYWYPVMILVLFTAIYSKIKTYLWVYIAISFTHFLNVWHVLKFYGKTPYAETEEAIVIIATLLTVSAFAFYIVMVNHLKGNLKPNLGDGTTISSNGKGKKNVTTTKNDSVFASWFKPLVPCKSKESMPFNKVDFWVIAIICFIYSVITFTNLGYAQNPETEYAFQSQEQIVLEFDAANAPKQLAYYLKTDPEVTYELSYALDGVNYTEPEQSKMSNVFCWGQKDLYQGYTSIRITNPAEDSKIGELIFLDENGNVLLPLNASDYPELFDENDMLPETFDFRSGTYFDEIYYHRTANEFIEGERTYENTHPPLGKIFMMFGALIFGTNPFGFRFAGALFGVLMLPFIYLLLRNLLNSRLMGAVAMTIMAFDFMHFTQTRISTIDVFVVFFIIAMYYFMEKYTRLSFYDTPVARTFLPLGACGVMFGLGVASKWTGLYAGVGLAIVFFITLYKRYMEYRYALQHPKETVNGLSCQKIIQRFQPNVMKTIGFCILFFVVVPFVLYTLSYIPFREYGQTGLLEKMWKNQISMYNYHSNLTATHGYASLWYEWPTMKRPVFYYSKILGNDTYQGISAFGNPALWYAAIPASLVTFYFAIRKKCATATFLSIGYLAQYVPWILVTRCTFLYHYFPSTPFLIAMVCLTLSRLQKAMPKKAFYILLGVYLAITIGLFIMFYPVISGMPVSGEYVTKFLRWQDNWVLIYNY